MRTSHSDDDIVEFHPTLLFEGLAEEEAASPSTREENRKRTASLIPPPGGDLGPFFDEWERISKEKLHQSKAT